MARIKIKDLPKGVSISKEEMRRIFGGVDMFVGRPAPMHCSDVPWGDGWYTQCGDPQDFEDSQEESDSDSDDDDGGFQYQGSNAVAGVRG